MNRTAPAAVSLPDLARAAAMYRAQEARALAAIEEARDLAQEGDSLAALGLRDSAWASYL